MRVVALEEHFTVPDLVQRIDPNAISRRGFRSRKPPAGSPNAVELLPEIGERRLQSMDEAGITVQVLSNGSNRSLETVSQLGYNTLLTRLNLGLGSAVSVVLFASVVLIAVV